MTEVETGELNWALIDAGFTHDRENAVVVLIQYCCRLSW